MFKVNNKNNRTRSEMSFWCFYIYVETYFSHFSDIFIVDFEHVNVIWDKVLINDFQFFSFS